MNKDLIINAIKTLSGSKGFYGRLYDYIKSEEGEPYLQELVNQNFKDVVDLIMYVENYG